MDANIIILAGGSSSRMKRSVNENTGDQLSADVRSKAKSMLPVGRSRRPFLDYLLYNIQEAGYSDVVLVIGEKDELIRRYYERHGSEFFPLLKLSYIRQSIPGGRAKPLGTADALLQALLATPSWHGKHVTVCNSDNLYSANALHSLLNDEHRNVTISYDGAALQFPDERVAQFALMISDSVGYLKGIVEKPSLDELRRARDGHQRVGVSMNIWRFLYDDIVPFLESLPLHPIRDEKELPLAVKMMVNEKPNAVFTLPFAERVIDLTRIEDLASVNEYLQQEFPYF